MRVHPDWKKPDIALEELNEYDSITMLVSTVSRALHIAGNSDEVLDEYLKECTTGPNKNHVYVVSRLYVQGDS